MSQDQSWRNDKLQRIRMREETTPTPQPQQKTAGHTGWRRSDVIFVGTLLSAVVGIMCYVCGEWHGSAKVAAATQPITLEALREKYGDQDWAMRFDDEHVIAMWDENRKVMTYLHLADDDYAALDRERPYWPRPNPFSTLVGAALSARYNVETEVPLPENRPALTLKEFEGRYGCWMIEAFYDNTNVVAVRKWEWNESRKGCDFTWTNPRLEPRDYRALKIEAMRDERVYSVEDACARVLKKRFPETNEQK